MQSHDNRTALLPLTTVDTRHHKPITLLIVHSIRTTSQSSKQFPFHPLVPGNLDSCSTRSACSSLTTIPKQAPEYNARHAQSGRLCCLDSQCPRKPKCPRSGALLVSPSWQTEHLNDETTLGYHMKHHRKSKTQDRFRTSAFSFRKANRFRQSQKVWTSTPSAT